MYRKYLEVSEDGEAYLWESLSDAEDHFETFYPDQAKTLMADLIVVEISQEVSGLYSDLPEEIKNEIDKQWWK